ncbi:MAG TPA: sigma-70 family RNA polymerase sigma factor [Planctomycetota bacterium]|nr:sigma-70 family RNA polymerase sigma factor [Planctomycetota bacterium]
MERFVVDLELVRRARDGDAAAFEEIVRLCLPRVLGVARSVVGRAADAEDVAQVVFYKVYRRLDTFREEASFYTWLYRVTVNAANDRLKQRRRDRSRQEEEFERMPVAPPSEDPARQAAKEDLRAQVRAAVQELPPKFRDVVVLREAHDLSCEEVAATLGIPFGTVVSRLFRARAKLKKILEKRLDGAPGD